ncbi:hypothetical protein Tco_1042233 [Tanacetum coccineum]|uniref:Uncharacterized protein n=1 Tax=Tanacetum coccineum TaxID=301880 RepID=A0ABQ5GIF8_9ASTR
MAEISRSSLSSLLILARSLLGETAEYSVSTSIGYGVVHDKEFSMIGHMNLESIISTSKIRENESNAWKAGADCHPFQYQTMEDDVNRCGIASLGHDVFHQLPKYHLCDIR